jgi:hypothetical protein
MIALLILSLCLIGAATATAHRTAYRPRIGMAMGLEPSRGELDVATGEAYPVVYHGGPVMSGQVTVHTIFWAPSGYQFDGPPTAGVQGYEPLVQTFFTDVAHDSGMTTNIFSLLDQYGDNAGPGHYSIAYSRTADAINDTDAYPKSSSQCPSPSSIAVCLTDVDVTNEVNHVIATSDPSGYGLHDLWEVYLPANVDECIEIDSCGTNDFGGYHSLADDGHGEFIYAVIIDPLIEESVPPGSDPEGNPDAEGAIDTAGHETMEAMTNPEGDAWMDPDGEEVADKCEDGPQIGTPLGFAADGSPYNQVINGDKWLIQDIWSNPAAGCVSSSPVTTDGLPLPSVSLHQFSPDVSGNIGKALGHVAVQVAMLRSGGYVAEAGGLTRSNGSWGPIALMGPHGALHGAGDDRDELLVGYGRGGPGEDLIATGAGGDPYSEAGWTNWYDLDTGFTVTGHAIGISPCSQTGALSLTVNGKLAPALLPGCQTETDVTIVTTPKLTNASHVVLTSEDNRAVSPLSASGAEVSLSVTLGEPGSLGFLSNDEVPLAQSGVPQCAADLRLQLVTCTGLVPSAHYTLSRARGRGSRRGKANVFGILKIADLPGPLPVTGGDVLTLRNSARRILTALHVAHLRVAIKGTANTITSGTCQPDDYFGAPLRTNPASSGVGDAGAAGLGRICPASGHAKGLSAKVIAETDDLSGGITQTSLPVLAGTTPSNDAIVPSSFRALAQTGIPQSDGEVALTGAKVSVTIRLLGARRASVSAAGANHARGVPVTGLKAGVYTATWVISDLNGDTRTEVTKFEVEG